MHSRGRIWDSEQTHGRLRCEPLSCVCSLVSLPLHHYSGRCPQRFMLNAAGRLAVCVPDSGRAREPTCPALLIPICLKTAA
jgi:hypothetical protein